MAGAAPVAPELLEDDADAVAEHAGPAAAGLEAVVARAGPAGSFFLFGVLFCQCLPKYECEYILNELCLRL